MVFSRVESWSDSINRRIQTQVPSGMPNIGKDHPWVELSFATGFWRITQRWEPIWEERSLTEPADLGLAKDSLAWRKAPTAQPLKRYQELYQDLWTNLWRTTSWWESHLWPDLVKEHPEREHLSVASNTKRVETGSGDQTRSFRRHSSTQLFSFRFILE